MILTKVLNMELHKFEDNSKYGYRDENDAIVIPAKYEEAKDFKDNLAIVKLQGFYGVINTSDKVIINFVFTAIEEHYLFFECKEDQENVSKTLWYNCNGIKLHEGYAKALSKDFLCISNGKMYGVVNQKGNKIINYLYDEIILISDYFVVRRKDKIGLYDLQGVLVIDAFCNSIESVVIENNSMYLGSAYSSKESWAGCYSGYCKEYCFDTNNLALANTGTNYNGGQSKDLLYRELITVKSKWRVYNINEVYNPSYYIEHWRPIKDITKPMIISTDSHKMMFLKEDGILPNSEFDDIHQITQICYIVKKDNYWGVYRIDTKDFVIPVEYEEIKFYGGHTVLLRKDKQWGARSLVLNTNIFNIFFKVSIPTEYLEIKILDDFQHFFGCKKKGSYSDEYYYTVVQPNGKEIYEISELECDSQFIYVDDSHLITSIKGKFGFINSKAQKIIPFKYDEISTREDGRFNVRINNRWGLLTIDGREITPVKYSSPLPKQFDKEVIVIDSESGCWGLVDSNGAELIPTIYEHLQSSEVNDIYFFGYGGFIDEEHTNFFSGDINNALWGAVTKNGKQIIEAKYDCLKVQSNYIVAGRDGGFFPDDDDDDYGWHGCNYGGVYDLYNKDGELLIGGFREFQFDEKNELFIFFFGGEWVDYPAFDDDWNNIHITGYKFEKGIDLWLILDIDLKTILRDEKGNQKQFEKGFIGRIEKKKEGNKIKHIYNMPIDLMAKGFSHVAINSVIINDSNSKFHKSQAVDIVTGQRTKFYSKIEQITDSIFFFAEDEKAGITNINSEILFNNCLFITYPVAGYILMARENGNDIYDVILRSINNIDKPIATAIKNIAKDDLVLLAEGHWLKMELKEKESGLKSLIIPRSKYLEKDFQNLVTTKEGTGHNPFSHHNEKNYFFSNDYHFLHD